MSAKGSERQHPETSSPRMPQDVEAFLADLVLNDYEGVHLLSIGGEASTFKDGMTDPNPARQEQLYQVAHENAATTSGQLPAA